MLYNSSMIIKRAIKDEISMFTSYPLVFQTVSDLRFDVLFSEGNIKTTESLVSN